MSIISDFPVSGRDEKANCATQVSVIAKDKISVGDTVYTVRDTHPEGFIGWDCEVKNIGISPWEPMLCCNVLAAALSPDGSLLAIFITSVEEDGGYIRTYSVSGTEITYLNDVTFSNKYPSSSYGSCIAFSPDGSLLIVCNNTICKVYSVIGQDISYLYDLTNFKTTGTSVFAEFSPDGTLLVFSNGLVYSVNGTTISYLSTLKQEDGTDVGEATAVNFLPGGNSLIWGTSVYSVTENAITYQKEIDIIEYGQYDYLKISALSPNGRYLIRNSDNELAVYRVNGTEVELADSYLYNETTGFDLYAASFSSNGDRLVTFYRSYNYTSGSASDIHYYIDLFQFSDGSLDRIQRIETYKDSSFDSTNPSKIVFLPTGNTFVLFIKMNMGGTSFHRIYSIIDDVITNIGPVPACAPTTAFGQIPIISKDSHGHIAALFETRDRERVCMFSFNENAVQFLSIRNITEEYEDGENHLYYYYHGLVKKADFSLNGDLLFLSGGKRTHFAPDDLPEGVYISNDNPLRGVVKVYSVGSNELTFLQDIILENSVGIGEYSSGTFFNAEYVQVSDDGLTAAISAGDYGVSVLYSINGTQLTYIGDIYDGEYHKNGVLEKDLLEDHAIVFAPGDNTPLVVTSSHLTDNGYGKIFTVSDGVINFTGNIPTNATGDALNGAVNEIVFSPNRQFMIATGEFDGKAKLYCVNGTVITYAGEICSDADGSVFSSSPGAPIFLGNNRFILCNCFYTIQENAAVYQSALSFTDVDGNKVNSGTVLDVSPSNNHLLFWDGEYDNEDKKKIFICDIGEEGITGAGRIYEDVNKETPILTDRYCFPSLFLSDDSFIVASEEHIKLCSTDTNGVIFDETYAFRAPERVITAPESGAFGVGFSAAEILQGDRGAVTIIGNVGA